MVIIVYWNLNSFKIIYRSVPVLFGHPGYSFKVSHNRLVIVPFTEFIS